MKRFIAKVAKTYKGGEKGFTLIELLIVIVILGVLAAAIIPNLSRFLGSGQVGAANAELASVRTAVAAYQTDHNGSYPCTDQPVLGSPELVLPDAIVTYITGSAGIRGGYTINYLGQVVDATNGGGSANSTVWPATIGFEGAGDDLNVDGVTASMMWVKLP